jgi:hypothetical protein
MQGPQALGLVLLASIAASFLTPYLWRGVLHPFEVASIARTDPLLRTIADLQPLGWNDRLTAGFPLLLLGWPVLLLLRWWRRGFDGAEIVLCAAFTALVLQAQRFAGFYALVAFPFVARDLVTLLERVRVPERFAAPAPRLAGFAVLALAAGWMEWSRADRPLDVSIDLTRVPVRAADFLGAQPTPGRGFNPHPFGGYLAYRFWPDRERLPFMDAHQSGTANDRMRYARTFVDPDGWELMNRSYRFDYALLDASQSRAEADWLRDRLDADTAWALVFLDDAGALYVKRSGVYASLLPRHEYIAVPGGEARLALLGAATERDSMLAGLTRFELERQIQESPFSARAHSMLANLDIQQGHLPAARRHLAEALRQDPLTFAAHERLGMMDLAEQRPREALAAFERERRLTGGTPELRQRLEQARVLARQQR